jgi:hypothetical protein
MCDENSSSLQNILQSPPRREPKIELQRVEYIFPALKDSLVSFFRVCAHITETYKCVFPEYYFWEHFAPKLIFLLICSTQLLEVFTQLSHCIWNILSYKKFGTLYIAV